MKRRFSKNDTTFDDIIKEYKESISKAWIDSPISVDVWWSDDPIVLDCKTLATDSKITGFRYQGEKWQYDLRTCNLGRPMAWRVPFLCHPNFQSPNYTVSHLCHNNSCYNWDHHTLENLDENKARNGCPGGDHCHHKIKCLKTWTILQFLNKI